MAPLAELARDDSVTVADLFREGAWEMIARRDSTVELLREELFADGAGGFPGFDLALTQNGAGTVRMFLGPNKKPRAILVGVFAEMGLAVRVVVLPKTPIDIVGVTDIEAT